MNDKVKRLFERALLPACVIVMAFLWILELV